MDMDEVLVLLGIVIAVVVLSLVFGYATYVLLNAVTPFPINMSYVDIYVVGLAELLVLAMLRDMVVLEFKRKT